MDKCESCVWYSYDEEYDEYICDVFLVVVIKAAGFALGHVPGLLSSG